MDELEKARGQIQTIDKEMARLFEERMKAAYDVAMYKKQHSKAVFDEKREQFLKEKNKSYIKEKQYIPYYEQFFNEMLHVSKSYQKQVLNYQRIGFQGTFGAFGYFAAHKAFPDAELQEYASFEAVMQAVEKKDIAYGVLPLENSFTGEVGEVSDLLRKYDVYIQDVVEIAVDHNLLGLPNTKTSQIKKIYSHPQALSQCATFLKGRDIELLPYPNTALAAKFVSEQQDESIAAIASKETADIFGLSILEEHIHTSVDNTTRFAIIGLTPKEEGNYFQLIFTTTNEAGALATVINAIASYGFSMESIKSRAVPEKPWEYYFHVEMKGSYHSEATMKLLEELKTYCEQVKYLGTYTK